MARRIGAWALAAAMLPLAAGIVPVNQAWAEDSCAVSADLTAIHYPMPHAAAALDRKHTLNVVVLGSTSSMSRDKTAPFRVYPALVGAALSARLPGAKINVTDQAKSNVTAGKVADTMLEAAEAMHPDLVIWETGTTDAVRNVDPNEFSTALLKGVSELDEHGADVVLVDIQYSPQTAALYNFEPYLDASDRVGDIADINVLHRWDIMRTYEEEGSFLPASVRAADQLAGANFVHGCMAKLLAAEVDDGVRAAAEPSE